MRPPSSTLVVDAAILIAAVLGRGVRAIKHTQAAATLVTTSRAIEEARGRVLHGLKRPELLDVLHEISLAIPVVPVEALEPLVARAEVTLRDAVASRNGSTGDAHILALAWSVDGDVWTADRDFAGTGVATWSTPNLLRALAPSPSPSA